MLKTIAFAAGFVLCGSVSFAGAPGPSDPYSRPQANVGGDGNWQGEYRCGQHKAASHLVPFDWRGIEFRIQGNKILGHRDFMGTNPQVGQAVAEFTGLLQPDGQVEILVVGRSKQPRGPEGFHGSYNGRLSGREITATGPMMTPDGRIVRECSITMHHA